MNEAKVKVGTVVVKEQVTKKEYSRSPLIAFGISLICVTSVASTLPASPVQASNSVRSNSPGITYTSGLYTVGTGSKKNGGKKMISEVTAMPTPKNSNNVKKATSNYRGQLTFVDNYEAEHPVEPLLTAGTMVKKGKSTSKYKGPLPIIKY